MPVIREYRCNDCSTEFEAIRGFCPRCSSGSVTRVFLTPVGISKGVAKRTDAILQRQFDKMGITNFSNSQRTGPNKVEWRPFKPEISGDYNSGGQTPIIPGTGINVLIQSGFNPSALERSIDTDQGPYVTRYTVPTDIGAGIPVGVPIGGRPTALYDNTHVVGGIDVKGKEVVRVR